MNRREAASKRTPGAEATEAAAAAAAVELAPELVLDAEIRPPTFLNAVAGTAGVNVVISVLGSAGGLLLARGLGPTQRGAFVAILVWPSVGGTLAAVGIPQATCYWISKQPEDRKRLMATATATLLVLGCLAGALGVAFAPVIGRSPQVVHGLRITFLLLPAMFVSAGWVSALQARSASRWNLARSVQPISYFVAVAGLLIAGRLTLHSAVAAYVGSLLLQLVLCRSVVRRTLGPAVSPDPALCRPLFHYGVRSVASAAPWIVNARLDQLILSIAVPSAALGNYAVAVSLSFLAGPVSTSFGSIAFPRIAAAATHGEARAVQRVAIIGSAITAVAVLAPLGILAPMLLPALFGDGFVNAVVPFRLLIPGTVAFVMNQVVGDILRGRGYPLEVAKAEGIGAVLTLVLLGALIPSQGINGAALASSIAYSLVTLLLFRALRRVGSA